MDNSLVSDILSSVLSPEDIFPNEPMSRHTTFRTGGNAAFLVTPHSQNEVSKLLRSLKDVRHMVVGNGSNLLFCDEGYDGVVIKLGNNFSGIWVEGNEITAQSGALLSKIASVALQNGLGGFEFASGIPGSLGGAVAMNAGAYGGEMKDVVVSSVCADDDGNIFEITDHKFSYRHTIFTDKNLVVLSSKIKLTPKNTELIRSEMTELNLRRREKQPLEYPSAGSTFKRPEGYFAGKLIEDSGLKGCRIGGAMVSEKHAGFLINYDHATAKDILNLIDYVKEKVHTKFGVTLEPEVRIIGKEK